MDNFPVWIKINSPKNAAIAQALIDYGFCYCGLESEFCEGYFLGSCCGWKLFSAIGEIAIDAVYDGALFSFDLHCSGDNNFEEELAKIKKIIIKEGRKFSRSKNYKQLKLKLF